MTFWPIAGRRITAALLAFAMPAIGIASVAPVAASAALAAEPPSVVVSIKPIHSLVAGVMAGIGEPLLLVDGNASPHAYSLKPSQAAALARADLVVWVGAGLESFLAASMHSLVQEGYGLELAALPGIGLLPVREGGVWDAHAHGAVGEAEHDHANENIDSENAGMVPDHDHAHEGYDPHIWLDPDHAVAIVAAVADRLRSVDPDNAVRYSENENALIDRLHALDVETRALLAPLHDVPFIVFHDAYQYFERHYGLHAVGSITLDPDQPPGAARLAAIRERLSRHDADQGGVVCAFAEPGVDDALLQTAVQGTGVRTAALDPEGRALAAGPGLYGELLGGMARSMAACLGGP